MLTVATLVMFVVFVGWRTKIIFAWSKPTKVLDRGPAHNNRPNYCCD
jgi:hypothetical protein